MFKYYFKITFVLLFISMASAMFSQNVGINHTATNPSINAILDLNTGNSNNLGLIIPNVSLSNVSVFNPPIANAPSAKDSGMLVYNTNGAVGNGAGYYYWNGIQWISFAAAGSLNACGGAALNYIPIFTSGTFICNSILYQASTTTVGVGTTIPQNMLDVNGAIAIGSYAGVNTAPANGMIVPGQVGLGNNTPNSSAALDLSNTSFLGFLTPRMTATQIAAIASPANGLIVYNTNTNCFEFYSTSNSGWNQIACPCTGPPSTVGAITPGNPASTSVCLSNVGQTFSVISVAGATSFIWSVPSEVGTWTGQGTNTITVNTYTATGIGTFSVTPANVCGTTLPASTIIVSVLTGNPVGSISPASLCFGGTGGTDLISISGLNNYSTITWSVSSNAICSAAVVAAANTANSASLTLSGGTGGSGTVTVVLTNGCGTTTSTTSTITYVPGGSMTINSSSSGTWTIPNCITQFSVTIAGGGGGEADYNGTLYGNALAGMAGLVQATISVAACGGSGSILTYYVGGAGGNANAASGGIGATNGSGTGSGGNGAGYSENGNYNFGGGGGACSELVVGASVIMVAGASAGTTVNPVNGYIYYGGPGYIDALNVTGVISGCTGNGANITEGGGPGTSVGGGAGGSYTIASCSPATTGTAGGGVGNGNGGNGGVSEYYNGIFCYGDYGSSGGGGGYTGGGGGSCCGSGGGGSSYTNPAYVVGFASYAGYATYMSPGYITITW